MKKILFLYLMMLGTMESCEECWKGIIDAREIVADNFAWSFFSNDDQFHPYSYWKGQLDAHRTIDRIVEFHHPDNGNRGEPYNDSL